jgi:DNA-binding XRE family transcriptional regulator
MYMTPEQCRAARGWLGWSRDQLAAEARVGRNTIARYEEQRALNESTKIAIKTCLERLGFRFPDDGTIQLDGRRQLDHAS